ncbi:MAG: DEAD/DEAH box helicase, partial [Candidatus Lokiarchaeota archaeon]|nr:DEAD/DEAH box helicase [Candidatus Lokiarchaeota archaeon]MBD3339898.1 DEAD/DEAH box helicase [Candidatus Lokiarchaeota archaeon]
KKESKIIFLAPTKPLVNQHRETFSNLIDLPKESLVSITGSVSPDQRKDLWDETRICFMTPQVLQNDIISNTYSLKDISLIIFDECHRAVGDYAYCYIAKKYVEDSRYPQILGLTASPGSTEEKINEIKTNLFIDHIEIRTESDPDVKKYVHKVDKEWIKVKLPQEFSKINEILSEKLKKIYKWFKEKELLNSYDISKVSRKDLLKLNKIINNRIASASSDDDKYEMFYAKKLNANALRISYMIELLETQGISSLNEYIKKNDQKILKNKANKSLKELFRDKEIRTVKNYTKELISKGIVHPKLNELKTILREQFCENKDSRVLVFSHFRDSVNNIVKSFEEDELIRVHKFVGQANKGKDKGLTQKEQINILKEFKEGLYNTLIATSVAEEGLDIAECDLVVFFDVVPSAIRAIQRRGRTGRKREGKVYILMAEGTRDEGYYWAEKAKEKNMKISLNRMRKRENSDKPEQSDLLRFVSDSEKGDEKNILLESNSYDSIEVIKDAKNFHIVCDNRETASPVVRILSLMGLNIELKQLPVADYIISERVGIERKSAQDFNDSIKDGRLFNELKEMKENFEVSLLILEGDPLLNSNLNSNALYGAISAVLLNLGISVYTTRDPKQTAVFLYHLAKKEQTDRRSTMKLRFDKAPLKTSYLMEYIISGVPGVNTLRAQSLLKEMKTLQNIFNSDITDLTKIKNIGRKIAQEIYKISRFQYKE